MKNARFVSVVETGLKVFCYMLSKGNICHCFIRSNLG